MITILNKKKGFYKVFDSFQDWEDFSKNNGIEMDFPLIRKDHERVNKGNYYRCITVLEYVK